MHDWKWSLNEDTVKSHNIEVTQADFHGMENLKLIDAIKSKHA